MYHSDNENLFSKNLQNDIKFSILLPISLLSNAITRWNYPKGYQMKLMKRANIYQASNYNVTFDPNKIEAYSYKWWRFVSVVGRRWFDRVNGNTYCSADVFFDGILVAEAPFEYGYGSYYRQAAFAELKRKKLIKLREHESDWQYCNRNKIELLDIVTDGLKKELKKERSLK